MNHQNLVLEYTFVSKMSTLAGKLNSLKKYLWQNDRKIYRELRTEIEEIKKVKETTTYFVMSSNELYVTRGIEILDKLEDLASKAVSTLKHHFITYEKIELADIINKLEEVRDEIDGLKVAFELVEHPKSFFA